MLGLKKTGKSFAVSGFYRTFAPANKKEALSGALVQ